MPPRRQRLSDRLTVTPGGQRSITGDEFRDMRHQAQELETRAARADELEQRASLVISEPDIYAPGSAYTGSRTPGGS